jgi:hypothetical protein
MKKALCLLFTALFMSAVSATRAENNLSVSYSSEASKSPDYKYAIPPATTTTLQGFVFEVEDENVQIEDVIVTPIRPSHPYIKTPGLLRAWALKQVTGGVTQVSGSTLVGDNPQVEVQGSSPDEIMAKLSQAELRFKLADKTKDFASVNAAMTDDNGFWRFYGWSESVQAQQIETVIDWPLVSSEWRLPKQNIELEMNSEQPIYVGEGFDYARILYRDSDGNFQWSKSLHVNDDGWLWFPVEYAGQNGQIVISSSDGAGDLVIDIKTGYEVHLQVIKSKNDVTLKNYKQISDVGTSLDKTIRVVHSFSSSNKQGDSPVVRVEATSSRIVNVVVESRAGVLGQIEYGIEYPR